MTPKIGSYYRREGSRMLWQFVKPTFSPESSYSPAKSALYYKYKGGIFITVIPKTTQEKLDKGVFWPDDYYARSAFIELSEAEAAAFVLTK